MTQPTPTQAPSAPGAAFDVPGWPGGQTQWTDQDESTTNDITTINSAAQIQIQSIQPYRQTDVVADWYLVMVFAQTYTPGSSTLTASAYAPMNAIGPTKQIVQNQYASVDVESGIDLYIFNLARPFDKGELVLGVNNYSNPDGSPIGGTATGYFTTAIAQVNNINAAQWATTTTSYQMILRLPAGQWFDKYYDLLVTGEPTTIPHPALVSPQYMAGTTRNITPQIFLNPGNAATLDLGPVNIGAGSGTYAGTNTLRLRRRAIYAGQPATTPPVYAWQYRWHTQRFGVNGQSRYDLPLPLDTGQLLMVYVRLFDPAAAGALGAPININTFSQISMLYGSGLQRWQAPTIGTSGVAALAQRQWFAKHGNLLPPGVIGFDFALDELGQITNGRAINTLTTAGIILHCEHTAPLSASAYAVLGTESLVYVT